MRRYTPAVVRASTGYSVQIETVGGPAAGTINRIHVWPAGEDPRIALVVLTVNDRPVSSWWARYADPTGDAVQMWIYYQQFRDLKRDEAGRRWRSIDEIET